MNTIFVLCALTRGTENKFSFSMCQRRGFTKGIRGGGFR